MLSWILSSLYPAGSFRSMLSGEAIRWFCGHFMEFCSSSPGLGWIVLLAMSAGTCRESGILARRGLYSIAAGRRRRGLVAVAVAAAVYVCALGLLTLVPHAVLLSAVGKLFPSPFSVAVVWIVSLFIFVVSVVYGVAVGSFRSLSGVACSLSRGVRTAAPLMVLYVFAAMTVNTLMYVFGHT